MESRDERPGDEDAEHAGAASGRSGPKRVLLTVLLGAALAGGVWLWLRGAPSAPPGAWPSTPSADPAPSTEAASPPNRVPQPTAEVRTEAAEPPSTRDAEKSSVELRECPGEPVNGLQLVVSADKYSCAPGDAINFTWRLVNLTDQTVRYVSCAPEVHISRVADRMAKAYSAPVSRTYGGPAVPVAWEDVKELPPRGQAVGVYAFTWPRYEGTTKYARYAASRSGVHQLTLVYVASRPRSILSTDAAEPPVWEGRLASGVMAFTVVSRFGGKSYPAPGPPPPVEEDF